MAPFVDRQDAGRALAALLKGLAHKPDVIVLALPRGGVPVAHEVAKALSVPLDVFIVRKLGAPGHEELAMGAIAMGGTIVLNPGVIRHLNVSKAAIDQVMAQEKNELERREAKYRGTRPFPQLAGKTIVLVDDGIATGASMRAAVQALRQYKPARLIIAVPVAGALACEEMGPLADQLICPCKLKDFYAVGQGYQDFAQTSDEEVYQLLNQTQ